MNQRTLIIFMLAVTFSVGGAFSLFAQQEVTDKEPAASEGDPTMPTTEDSNLSESIPEPPFFGAGPMVFAKQETPYAGRARAFQGNPMPPGPEGPMFFAEPPMPIHENQAPFREGPMSSGKSAMAFDEEDMISLEAIIEYLSMELELTEDQMQALQELKRAQIEQYSPFGRMDQRAGFQQRAIKEHPSADPQIPLQESWMSDGPMVPPGIRMAERPVRQDTRPMFFGRSPVGSQGHRRMGPPSFREQMDSRSEHRPFIDPPTSFSGHLRGLVGEPPTPFEEEMAMNAEELMKDVGTKLELTEEQEGKIQPLLEEHFSSMREQMKAWHGQNRQQFQEGEQKMRQEIKIQLAEILTEKQLQKLREMKEFRLGHFPYFGFADRPGAFKNPLNDLQLSQEQQQKIFTIVEKYGEPGSKKVQNFLDMRAAMAVLFKQDEFDEQRVRELFQEKATQWEERFVERAKMLAEVKAVLSPEQIDIFQEKGAAFIDMMERWHGRGQ